DAMRWFLMSSPILRGGNLVVTEQGIREGVRQAMLPLWNSYSFFQLYASRRATWRTDSQHVLDRYILSRLASTRDAMTAALDATDIAAACDELRLFADALTNWYVRRSRSRFWAGEDSGQDSRDAFDTLYTVLETTMRLASPLLPLMSEVVWTGLTGEESVHLADWPAEDELPRDAALVEAMEAVRDVCSTVSSIRKAKHLRVRLPLNSLTVAMPDVERLEPFTGIIADEVNVREVRLTGDVAAHGRMELAVNARAAGPRLGKQVQACIKAAKTGDWTETDGVVVAGGVELQEGEYEHRLVAADPESTAALPGGAGLVVLDLTVTEELEAEGWAKDRIREIQEARRAAGFDISDRIRVRMAVPADRREWADRHAQLIAGEVLATDFALVDGLDSAEGEALELAEGVRMTLARI
ncbi:MAG: class I tRNA ligase family protein, partial [Dietzia sp.]